MKPSNKAKRYLELAKQKAWESTFKHKHGAVLVRGGNVINVSFNSPDYSSFAERFKDKDKEHFATRHAEIMCVLGMPREKTEGSTLFVVRINNKGEFMMSKPCDMCSDAMKFVGVKKVVYTINKDEIGVDRL